MRHPFQRATNDKDTVKTPFQKVLVREISAYSKNGERMSGRKLSLLLGKSGNHVSLMLNDGFIPSGPAILEIAEQLELDQARRDEMIRAAMETKAQQRSRDSFWITETLRLLRVADQEKASLEAFIEAQGLSDAYAAWAAHAGKGAAHGRSDETDGKTAAARKPVTRENKRSARSKKD